VEGRFGRLNLYLRNLTAICTQRDGEIDFGDIVKRPPIAWKPFAFIRSPYRYGCSILCNHPVDPEFKGALRDKEIWVRRWENDEVIADNAMPYFPGRKEFRQSRTTLKAPDTAPTWTLIWCKMARYELWAQYFGSSLKLELFRNFWLCRFCGEGQYAAIDAYRALLPFLLPLAPETAHSKILD
jgi:hypothetical protein